MTMEGFSSGDVYLAPLAGYTDLPFRRACRAQGLRLGFTALIDAGALVYGNKENRAILARGEDEDWLGVQLLGSKLEFLEKAVPMLEAMEYDEFNFNMGCPVKKVIQREAGAALLGNRDHALDCVRLIRSHVKSKPFSVKLRILSESDVEETVSFCRELAEAGVEKLYIHGRLASKIYSGPVACDVIRAVKESVGVPVIANGGIFSLSDAIELRVKTGCPGVMVARGTIGNPWLFKSILEGREVAPTHGELCGIMDRHVRDMAQLYGEEDGLVNARKIILGYMGGRGYHRSLKLGVCSLRTLEAFDTWMSAFRADRNDGDIVATGLSGMNVVQ